nr:AIPR family protein [Myxococcus sp. RHSTA-1-4]
MRRQQPVDATLRTVGKSILEEFDFRRVFIGRVQVGEIGKLFETNGDKLLERNIRRYLGLKDNRVNSAIYKTLEDPKQRSNFYFFNNGITAICTKFTHNALQGGDHTIRVENLQIVNGGQTSKTIQKRIQDDPTGDYQASSVLLRLYELASRDDDLVNNITYATNSQNPVDLTDLRSNDPIQDRLALGLKELGFEYKRKRDDIATGGDTITSSVAAEAIMAVWRRKPNAAKFRRSRLFGDLYQEIFREDLLPAHVLLSVLVFRLVENERKRGSLQARFVPYASHFLAMVVGDVLLRSKDVTRDSVDHENLPAIREYFDKNRQKLYKSAVRKVTAALKVLGVTEETALPRVAAQFRRGDLLEPLEKELEKRVDRQPRTSSRARKASRPSSRRQ